MGNLRKAAVTAFCLGAGAALSGFATEQSAQPAKLGAFVAGTTQPERVLYSFCSRPKACHDGGAPTGRLRLGRDRIYGTTSQGGRHGRGNIFRLNASGSLDVLYNFCSQPSCTDGGYPGAGVLRRDGVTYGTTPDNGSGDCGCGTVFGIARDGTETTLHAFAGGADGANPYSELIADAAGNLYGVTPAGGRGHRDVCRSGCGTVFKVTPGATETVLYAFCRQQPQCSDGADPSSPLVADSAGNLYGTTTWGGRRTCRYLGCGIVYKLAPDGTETVLYAFTGKEDGSFPDSLVRDHAGNLYGTALGGAGICYAYGCGTIFKIAADGKESTLYRFCSQPQCADGAQPAGLAADAEGNLYGTTFEGGTSTACSGVGCGTVFELAADGTETTLYSFCTQPNCADGAEPQSGVVVDRDGNLFGTTFSGGANNGGVVFEIPH